MSGPVELRSGESLSVAELRIRTRQDRFIQSLRAGWITGLGAGWAPVYGPGGIAVEGTAALRKPRGAGKGLWLGAGLGIGVSPTRISVEKLLRKGRGAFWASLAAGWGHELRALRMRLGWQWRLTGIPWLDDGASGPIPAEDSGWVIFSMGPQLDLGLMLDAHAGLLVSATLQSAVLDLDGEGPGGSRVESSATISGGLEIAF